MTPDDVFFGPQTAGYPESERPLRGILDVAAGCSLLCLVSRRQVHPPEQVLEARIVHKDISQDGILLSEIGDAGYEKGAVPEVMRQSLFDWFSGEVGRLS